MALPVPVLCGSTHWNYGPYIQFGISSFLCEGAGSFRSKQKNLASGAVLMKSISEYYKGTRKARPGPKKKQ